MNILLVADGVAAYGAGHSLLNVASGLKKKGLTVYVAVSEEDDTFKQQLKSKGIEYVSFPIRYNCNLTNPSRQAIIGDSIINFISVLKLVYYIKHWKIDIVHTNNARVDIGAEAALIAHKPHVWHIREYTKEDFNLDFNFEKKTHWLMKHSTVLVAVSKDIKKKYDMILKKHNVVTVYNGVSIEDYIQSRETYFDNEVVQLLLCGGILPNKGQMEAIDAVDKLINNGIRNIHLKIVGSGQKSYVLSVKNYISSKNLNDYIQVIDYTKDLRTLRKNADIALVCSKREGFGRVTVESMLSELLVIGANSGGTKELIGNNQRGLLYQQGNSDDLAEKIEYAMNHKVEMTQLMKHAKNFAVNNCSEERLTEKLLKLYGHII